MSGANYDLLAQGLIDKSLTGNAQTTFWRSTWKRHTRFSIESLSQPFNTNTNFGQLNIQRFVNPSGMLAAGANVMRQTEASGPPTIGTPGSNGLGLLKQGFVERSNVQIVNELVNLIVAQRAYEVNSRAIQASDQMLSTATNLSR